MTSEMKETLSDEIGRLHLPRYREIPDVGLYLEQVTKYIDGYLTPLGENLLTGSMISNYVKRGLIANPVKKQYDRERIAYLFFIAVAKSVLTLDDLKKYLNFQKLTYDTEKAYNYFCDELENVLSFVFGRKDHLDDIGTSVSDAKDLLRSIIIAVAQEAYLKKSLNLLAAGEDS